MSSDTLLTCASVHTKKSGISTFFRSLNRCDKNAYFFFRSSIFCFFFSKLNHGWCLEVLVLAGIEKKQGCYFVEKEFFFLNFLHVYFLNVMVYMLSLVEMF